MCARPRRPAGGGGGPIGGGGGPAVVGGVPAGACAGAPLWAGAGMLLVAGGGADVSPLPPGAGSAVQLGFSARTRPFAVTRTRASLQTLACHRKATLHSWRRQRTAMLVGAS